MGVELLVGAAISTALSAGMSYGFGKLFAKKQKPPPPTPIPIPQSPDPLDDSPSVGGPLPGLFGHRRIAGKTLCQVRVSNATYIVQVILGAEVTGIDAVYINNKLVTIDGSGNVTSEPWANTGTYSMQVYLYDGTQTTVDPVLTAELPAWTADYIGEGIAYAVIKIYPAVNAVKFASTYNSGVPNFSYHVRGFKCFDPRVGGCILGTPSTYIFSVNASIIEANYMIHPLGGAFSTSLIDWASVSDSADVDDENVSLASGGSERRYTACLYWMSDETHETVLARIGAAHAGGLRPLGSGYKMFPGSFPASTVPVTVDDYAGDGLTVEEGTPIGSRANGVRGKFVSPVEAYEKRDFPSYQNATDLAADGAKTDWLTLDLDCVYSHTQAQRLSRIAYWRNRYGSKSQLTTKFSMFDVVADDVLSLTDTMAGLAGSTFRVQSESLEDDDTISFDLTYETAACFSWTAGTDEQAYVVSTAVEGETGDLRPNGGAMIDTVTPGGTIVPNLAIWPSPSTISGADHYRLRKSGVSIWTGPMSSTVTGLVTVYAAGAAINGDWTLNIEDASNTFLLGNTVAIAIGHVASEVADKTQVNTPFYILPAPPQPLIQSQTAGSVTLFVPDQTSIGKADYVRIRSNTTNNSAGSSIASALPVSGAGTGFTIAGTQ